MSRKRKLLLLAAVILMAGVWFTTKLIWFKPLSINHYYERVFLKYALNDNQQMSELGLFGSIGRHLYNDKLTDVSPAHTEKLYRLLNSEYKVLKSYNKATLTESQKVSWDILDWYLNNEQNNRHFSDYNFKVNNYLGMQKKLPEYMVNAHLILDKTDAQHYIKRLKGFTEYFNETLESLKQSEKKKLYPPTYVVRNTLSSMNDFIATPIVNNILLTSFEAKLKNLNLPQDEFNQLRQEAITQIKESVYPAYEKLISHYREISPKTTDYVGIWHLPGGDKYYAQQIKSYTTLDMTPSQVFDMIYADVKRLNKQINKIVANPQVTKADIGTYNPLVTLQDCQRLVDDTDRLLPKLFGILPKAKVTVQITPDTGGVEGGIQQYNPSDINGTRPATIFITNSLLNSSRYAKQWILYHEGVPGHHLQIALNNEQKNVPSFRRILGFAAFSEGWATYAQHLPWEYDLTGSDVSTELEMLYTKLEHAGRVLIDIGVNAKHWTRQQAIDFAQANHLCSTANAGFYVEFCTTYPAFECSYEVGCLKIQQLRDKAKALLKDRFDIKAFHTAVLKNGSIPLTMLEKQVNEYIQQTQRSGL